MCDDRHIYTTPANSTLYPYLNATPVGRRSQAAHSVSTPALHHQHRANARLQPSHSAHTPRTSALTSVDFPTPECPTRTLTRSCSRSCSADSPESSPERPVTTVATPSGRYVATRSLGGARSLLVRQSTGSSPPAYAATRQRSM